MLPKFCQIQGVHFTGANRCVICEFQKDELAHKETITSKSRLHIPGSVDPNFMWIDEHVDGVELPTVANTEHAL